MPELTKSGTKVFGRLLSNGQLFIGPVPVDSAGLRVNCEGDESCLNIGEPERDLGLDPGCVSSCSRLVEQCKRVQELRAGSAGRVQLVPEWSAGASVAFAMGADSRGPHAVVLFPN